MNIELASCPGIFFRIRDPFVSQIVSWRRDVDEAVMRFQLGRSSSIPVFGLQGQGLTQISELPERGKFAPFYGDVGGGFSFVFHPAGKVTELMIETAVSKHPMFHPDPIEPLKLTIPKSMLTEAEVYKHIGIVGPDDTLTYLPEFLFGFYGEYLDMYREWEWHNEDVKKFDFIFAPTSVGTMVNVLHRESGALLDLTRNFEW
jgi:hypothetical protein